jgi:hypothetical protein
LDFCCGKCNYLCSLVCGIAKNSFGAMGSAFGKKLIVKKSWVARFKEATIIAYGRLKYLNNSLK